MYRRLHIPIISSTKNVYTNRINRFKKTTIHRVLVLAQLIILPATNVLLMYWHKSGISRQPRRSFLTFTQLHRTIWLQEQRVRSCCNLHITTIMRQFDKVLDKFGNLHQSDFPLSLIVIATGKVCLIITYQHLLGTHQFTVFKEFVQIAQVLVLFLDYDDKLLCRVVQLCITQTTSMSEIEYVIYRNDNLLVNRPVFLEISEIIPQSLYGLSCQSIRSLGHHHSDVDATVETQAHDTEESICFTALHLT